MARVAKDFSRAVTLFGVFQIAHLFADESPDKSRYNLLRPAPDALLREIDWLQDANGSDYHEEIINTVTVSHDIAGKLAGYVELFSNLSTECGAKWTATFDFGFTYAVTRDIQLDAGMNIGLTDAADDLNPFIGLSLRY